MSARSIILDAAAIRAILDGTKTQERRPLKEAYSRWDETAYAVCPARESGWIAWFSGLVNEPVSPVYLQNSVEFTKAHYRTGFPCPFGAVGDRLYVREKWAYVSRTAYACSPGVVCRPDPSSSHCAVYAAGWDRCQPGPWKSPATMPRWASRITLEVTGVRVERLNEISNEDLQHEGMTPAAVCALLSPLVSRAKVENPYWIEGDPESLMYCHRCIDAAARKYARENPDEELRIGGGSYSLEGDTSEICETCGVLLNIALLESGARREIEHFKEQGISGPRPAWEFLNAVGHESGLLVGETCLNRPYLPDLVGDVNRIGYRWLWDALNSKRGFPWESNPWTWALTWRRVEP